jgi:NAD(P)-dependent dehydrogenase (short-subunit alcohol dehydrogenase family)
MYETTAQTPTSMISTEMGKVALITGGGRITLIDAGAKPLTPIDIASGMGLAVAKALSARNDWHIHILDINQERGIQTTKEVPRTTFHRANVTKYSDLAAAFQNVFLESGSLDFVFANAGVIERTNFYATHSETGRGVTPPPEPDLLSIDADLKGVVLTSYLAQHYFRHSPHRGKGSSLVMTASCGGLYPSPYSPLYSAAKCKSLVPCS